MLHRKVLRFPLAALAPPPRRCAARCRFRPKRSHVPDPTLIQGYCDARRTSVTSIGLFRSTIHCTEVPMAETNGEPRLRGGCLCGAIRYEISAWPISAVICHCRMCQKGQGAPLSAAARFPESAFRFTKGRPRVYKSSAIAERSFCSECGSPMLMRYAVPPYGPEDLFVKIGTLDDPDAVRPESHYGVESQVSWLCIEDDLPRQRCDEDPGMAEAWRLAGVGTRRG